MSTDAEWASFNPGFDHGEVEVRSANIAGVFTADKIAHLKPEELHGAEVRMANLGGQIGEESFDWSSVDTGGADVRTANCKGQLGSERFDWGTVDLGGADVRRANLKGTTIDERTFDGLDKGGADVRAPNVAGQVGDPAFNDLLRKLQTPTTLTQSLWRLGAFPLSLTPFLLVRPAMGSAPERFGLTYVAGAAAALTGVWCVRTLLKKVLMVKSGTLTLAQYAENGTTHVLQAGIHLGAGLGTTTQTFDIKEDNMRFGTVSFVRVRPGFLGLATENGKPVLLLPGQHLMNDPNFELQSFADINETRIVNGPLNLVRVPPSQLGLATLNKQPVILDAGLHFIYSPGFQWQSAVSVNKNFISNGPISIIRVQPGFIGFATQSKRAVLLGVGLHFINDPSFEFLESKNLTQANFLQNSAISLVRIEPSTIGLATINKKPVILDAGVHLIFEPTFEFAKPVSVNDDNISIGPVNIIRVGPGRVGLATLNGNPTLLDTGVHFINEPSFCFSGFKRVDEPLIKLGPLHIVTVPRGMIVPVMINGEGHFLLEGRHFIKQARINVCPPQALTDEYVTMGTRHRIVVPQGRLGLALERGEPVIYEPCSVHLVNSDLFEYRGSVDVTQQLVLHASLKIITVKDGQVGITYNNGTLELLETGRHTIEKATHVLAGFVSTGQQTLRIAEVTGMSLDNVELTFDAAICVRVVDAQKAVVMLTSGRADANIVLEIQENIQERAKLDLSTIIGKNRLNKKHEATTAGKSPAPDTAEAAEAPKEAPGDDFVQLGSGPGGMSAAAASEGGGGFRTAIHDSFMHLFREEMRNECGVEVINMAIEDVKIVDGELAKALASAAVANSALERQTIEAEIVQVKAQADSKVATIEAEGRAAAMHIMARAEADRIKTISDTLGEACAAVQQQEAIRVSGSALTSAATVMLAQDTGALATLLGGAQGASIAPAIRR